MNFELDFKQFDMSDCAMWRTNTWERRRNISIEWQLIPTAWTLSY